MKEKLLNFFIGFLVGAIITTGGFLIYEKCHVKRGPREMNGNIQSQMRQNDFKNNDKKNGNSTNQGTPPNLPSDKKPDGNAPAQNNSTNKPNAPTQNNSINQPTDNLNSEKGQS